MRREDWPERLIETIERHAGMPFAYGTSDCFTLPLDCVLAMTGEEPWPEVRGAYRTKGGAGKQLRKRGFKTLAEAFAARFEEVPVAMAQRGDIGVVVGPETVGVVFVGADAMGKADAIGNKRVARSDVTRAFRVA